MLWCEADLVAGAHLEVSLEELIGEHLQANGWVRGLPEHFDRDLGLDTAELFAFLGATQGDEWERLVQRHGSVETAQRKFAHRVAAEIDSRGTVDVLRRGVTDLGVRLKLAFFAPAHDLTPELRVLYGANRVTVTRQAHVSETRPGDSVDLLLGVNGLPVAVVELKSQTAGQSVEDAVAQFRRARNPHDRVFAKRAVVCFAVDQDNVLMATRLAGDATVFLPFNTGSNGPGRDGGAGNPLNPHGPRTAFLWEQVWQRDAWLDLLGSFVHVEKQTVTDPRTGAVSETRSTVFPRYHQWDVVTKMLVAARADGPGRDVLAQHSAGSGKSNSIAWLAHGLSSLHTPGSVAAMGEGVTRAGLGPNQPVFDKVVIVTDRVVLDRQLQETVASFDHPPGMIAAIGEGKSSKDLQAALEGKTARIVVTTLQKFPVVAQTATALSGARFAVIVDEAHSSQTGEAVKDLKAVLAGTTGEDSLQAAEQAEAKAEQAVTDTEDLLLASARARGSQGNLSFFAFTATPKAKTLERFGERSVDPSGDERFVPFHLYSMRQAIAEGFILDVLASYTTYATYYRLANGLGAEDVEVPKGKALSALARFVSLHPTNLAQKAEIIVEHFRAHTAAKIGGQAKAMVVTRSRLHALRYYQALKAYVAEKGYDKGAGRVGVLVAFSGSLSDPDVPNVSYTEAMLNGFGDKELPKRFAGADYPVLVVAEKYQTGFDAPLLHTMYVDKPLAGVKAVQTLSRLNRVHPGKTDTFVLDFANTAEDMQAAFAPYYAETIAAPTDPNVLYNLQQRILDAHVIDPDEMRAGVEAVLAGGAAGAARLNAATDPAVERFQGLGEDEREDFRSALSSFVRAYAFLGQIIGWTDPDLEALYYYGKYLATRLPAPGSGASVDLDGSVILTHLRTDLKAEQQNLSLVDETGDRDPLHVLVGEGRGKQVEEPVEALSALIATLNERFGMDLDEADRVWFEQQKTHMEQQDDVRAVALGNDFEQFRVWLAPKIQDAIIDRQDANADLFQAFFNKPEFEKAMTQWLTEALYGEIRGKGAS